jgi:hypothetical protein
MIQTMPTIAWSNLGLKAPGGNLSDPVPGRREAHIYDMDGGRRLRDDWGVKEATRNMQSAWLKEETPKESDYRISWKMQRKSSL